MTKAERAGAGLANLVAATKAEMAGAGLDNLVAAGLANIKRVYTYQKPLENGKFRDESSDQLFDHQEQIHETEMFLRRGFERQAKKSLPAAISSIGYQGNATFVEDIHSLCHSGDIRDIGDILMVGPTLGNNVELFEEEFPGNEGAAEIAQDLQNAPVPGHDIIAMETDPDGAKGRILNSLKYPTRLEVTSGIPDERTAPGRGVSDPKLIKLKAGEARRKWGKWAYAGNSQVMICAGGAWTLEALNLLTWARDYKPQDGCQAPFTSKLFEGYQIGNTDDSCKNAATQETVMDADACKSAAHYLGGDFQFETNLKVVPAGCYTWLGTPWVYFNTHEIGAAHDRYAPVCSEK